MVYDGNIFNSLSVDLIYRNIPKLWRRKLLRFFGSMRKDRDSINAAMAAGSRSMSISEVVSTFPRLALTRGSTCIVVRL
jgi:hypothetical protein